MTWGIVTIGGIEFREETDASQAGDGALRIFGQEAHPPRSRAHVEAAHANVTAMDGLLVPVVFTDKPSLTGFYRVSDAGSHLHKWANGVVQTATWDASLTREGSSRDVEVESRVPTIARLTDHAVTPVFWHAPAAGARAYYTGATVPAGTVSRISADGVIAVHTGIPAGIAPRWTIDVNTYLAGSSRLLFDGFRRIGVFTPPLAVWEMNNGLVKVQAGNDGAFTVSCWSAGAWRSAKSYQVYVSGSPLTDQPELTILRNDPEETAVRLTYPGTPGRTALDLSLRRGSRFVTGLVKRHSAATMRIQRTESEAATAFTGGIRATAVDADGNAFVLGSARTISSNLVGSAYISKATATSFDFFAGHAVGAAPVTGDAATDLMAQYLGSTGERVRLVRRGESGA